MKKHLRFILFLGALLVLAFGTKLFAASTRKDLKEPSKIAFEKTRAEALQSSLNPVTIISSRLPSFKTFISDIPANVSYKSFEELNESHPQTYQEAIQDAEGAVFYDNVGNGLDKNFGLRGFADPSAVITLVDGVRVNEVDGDAMTYPLIPMYDVESIQVERGSQSLIYGSGAFGGVVNITTRRPSLESIHFFGGTEWTSFSGVRFHQGISGSVPDKKIISGARGTYYFDMGRTLSGGFRNNGDVRLTFLDSKLGYELPNDNGGIRVGLKHVEDAISNPGELTLDQYHADPHATNKPLDGRDFRNTILQIEGEKKFWDGRISTSILNSWRTNWIHFFSTFATFSTTFPTQLTTIRSRATDLIWQIAYQDQWKWFTNRSEFGIEGRNSSEHANRQNVVGGNVAEGTGYNTDRSGSPNNIAIFWRETVGFFEKLSLHYGMRHDFSWAEIDDNLTPANNYTHRWRKSTLSTGATVHPVGWMDLFSNFSQGFRVPAISEINSFNSDLNATLEPEKSDSFEIGTRLRYREVAQAKTSLFLIDVDDEIVFDGTQSTSANPFGRNVNAGKTRRYGIENRLDVQPVPEIAGYGSYTWMKGYISEAPPGGRPFNDRELGQIPQNRFTTGVTVTPLKRWGAPYEGFKIKIDGVITSQQHSEAFESTSQALLTAVGSIIKPYTVWNCAVLFEWKGEQIYFKINNLFGEKYFSRARASSSSGGIYPSGNYFFVDPGAPREYLVGMSWKFGS